MAGLTGDAAGQYMDFLLNPTASPLFQNALAGLLAQMQPERNAAIMGMNDMFRAAGNTASSTYGDAAAGLASRFYRDELGAAGSLLTNLFPQMANALFAPLGQVPELLNANKLSRSVQQSQTETGGGTEQDYSYLPFGARPKSRIPTVGTGDFNWNPGSWFDQPQLQGR
jgi:hypothetical protein